MLKDAKSLHVYHIDRRMFFMILKKIGAFVGRLSVATKFIAYLTFSTRWTTTRVFYPAAYRRHLYPCSGIIFLDEGLLKWLLTGENSTSGAVDPPGVASSATNNGNRAGQRAEAARGRRGRRGWERRPPSSAVGTDHDDARKGKSAAVVGADVGGRSLPAQALASASQASATSQESHGGGGWCENRFDCSHCAAGTERGEQAVYPVAQNELEFLVDKPGRQDACNDEVKVGWS